MNRYGYSSRLGYDAPCAYKDKVAESTGPLQYMMDTNKIYNCDGCLSTLGPRSGFMGFGVATPTGNVPAVAQTPKMVNIESILTNRNVPTSKCKKDEANPVNVLKFPVKHPRVCNEYLNPESSLLSYPAANYRDIGINRFYNLPKPGNSYANIYKSVAENTTLTLLDNFFDEIPSIWANRPSMPKELAGTPKWRSVKQYPIYNGYKQ